MIVVDKGKNKSVRTPGELSTLMKTGAENLSADEFLAAFHLLETMDSKKSSKKEATERAKLEKLLNTAMFDSPPVSPETFLMDDYFLGRIGKQLFPKLVDDFIELFSGSYNKVMILGSLGTGKSSFAQLGMARIIYQLSCYKFPQLTLGLQSESRIDLIAISIKLGFARKILLEPVSALLKQSPYFIEQFPFESTADELRFPKNINFQTVPNDANAAISLNVLGGVIDEVNFMDSPHNSKAAAGRVEPTGTAENLYGSLSYRVKSRFQLDGLSAGMLFLVSSKRLKTDFTEKQIIQDLDDPRVFVRDHNIWEMKSKHYVNSKWFNVLVGSDLTRSRILGKGETMSKAEEENGCFIVEVPEEFRRDFEFNVERSLRDLAGIPTEAINPFIGRRDLIMDVVNPNYRHPFSTYEWTAGTHYQYLWDMLSAKDNRTGEVRPILNPDAPRHAHIDSSLTGDSTGLAVGHIGGWKRVAKKDDDGKEVVEELPIIIVDFILRINPPKGEEINLGDVRQLIYMLSQEGGFPITFVSLDGFQCLTGETRIPTNRGIVKMSDILEGDYVQSRIGKRAVLKKYCFGEQDTFRITTDDGRVVEGTTKHKIEVKRGRYKIYDGHNRVYLSSKWEWVKLKDIEVGDVLRVWADGSNLVDGDAELTYSGDAILGRTNARKVVALNGWMPPQKMTEQFSEWLGLIWGDGNIGQDGIRLTVERTELSDALSIFDKMFDGRRYGCFDKRHENAATLSVSGRWLVRWMDENGLRKPFIPEKVLCSSKKIKAAFLRGLFSTDGSVKKRDGQVSLSTKWKVLAEQVRELLLCDFGLDSVIVETQRGYDGDYVCDGAQYIVAIRGSRKKFLEQIGFCYSDKLSLLEKHSDVPGRNLHSKVVKIESSRTVVYDLTIDGDPSYILSNGIVSHNSADAKQHFQRKGYKSEIVSVDRTPGPYLAMKYAIYEQRLETYEYEPFLEEARALEWNVAKHKVDHPENGRKDCTDAVAAICWTLQGLDSKKGIEFRSPEPQHGIIERNDGDDDDGGWVLDGTARPVQDQRSPQQQRQRAPRGTAHNDAPEEPKIDKWWESKN